MVMKVFRKPSGELVAADPAEAKAFGWTPQQAVQQKGVVTGTVFVPAPPPKKPLEQIITEKRLSGVLQVAGAEPKVFKFKEEPKPEVRPEPVKEEVVAGKVQHYIGGLPVSPAVAKKYEVYRKQQTRLQQEQYFSQYWKERRVQETRAFTETLHALTTYPAITTAVALPVFYGLGYVPYGRQILTAVGVGLPTFQMAKEHFEETLTPRKALLYTGVIAASAAISIYAARKVTPEVEETRVPVKYVKEERAIVAEEVQEFKGVIGRGVQRTVYYGAEETKELANAILIQKETAAGVARTIVTPAGEMISPPKGAIKFRYGLVSKDLVTIGTGIMPEQIPKGVPFGKYPISEVILKPEPTLPTGFVKVTRVGIQIDVKKPTTMFRPTEPPYPKTPLAKHFPPIPKVIKTPTPSITVPSVVEPVTEVKVAPIRIEAVKGFEVITGFEEVPKVFPKARPMVFVPQIGWVKQEQFEKPTQLQRVFKGQIQETREAQKQREKLKTLPIETQKRFEKLGQITHPIQKEVQIPAQATVPTQRQKQLEKQTQRQFQQQRQTQRQMERQIKKEVERPTIELDLPLLKRTGEKLKFRKPRMVKFYPYGRKRKKVRVVPRAGLLSLGREMGESIRRGKWEVPKALPKTKKIQKRFAKQLFTKGIGMEFPTAKMLTRGEKIKFTTGSPGHALKSVMPTSRKRRRKRR